MRIVIQDLDLAKAGIVAVAVEQFLNHHSGFQCNADFSDPNIPYVVTTKAARKRYQLGRIPVDVENPTVLNIYEVFEASSASDVDPKDEDGRTEAMRCLGIHTDKSLAKLAIKETK